jgi:hypothetical protein
MDPRRAHTERNMLPTVGPGFLRGPDGAVWFQYVIDPGNVIGPRPATRRDQESHAGAWAAFTAAEGVSALDRDGSGEDGGSLPAESAPVPVETVAVEAGGEAPPVHVERPVATPKPRAKRRAKR